MVLMRIEVNAFSTFAPEKPELTVGRSLGRSTFPGGHRDAVLAPPLGSRRSAHCRRHSRYWRTRAVAAV